jgi:hypothetical protein
LDAAIACFWHRGYEATSVRDLADSMGISGPSLYNAFGDKRALFVPHWSVTSITPRERESSDSKTRFPRKAPCVVSSKKSSNVR